MKSMKQHRAFPVLLLALALCLATIAGAQLSEHYDLTWNALGGGGGGAMDSSSYTMSGTIGQIIGLSGSSTYQLGTGYETVLTSAPVIHANKTVRDPENGTWVKDLTATSINDTLRFSCTITNTGTSNLSNLTQLRFWDVLDCSLEYAGNATLKNASGTEHAVTLPCAPEEYCFKQKVLHNTSWDPYAPLGTEFLELCPGVGNHYVLELPDHWEDTNNDSRLSACDQIYMTTMPGAWYHVDNGPYTLNVTDVETGESSYLDSVLDYEAIALSAPTHTEWVEVCGCKDECTVESWTDDGDLNLSANDTILLRNARTGEAAEYTVADVTIDLVVSREWEIDVLWGDSLTLEPNESVRIEYDATVLRCGVDRNTFRAKGVSDGNWTYSNEDFVSITVLCPSGDAADDSGSVKNEFLTGEDVYAKGSGFTPGTHVDIYIVDDRKWVGGELITNYTVYAIAPNILTDGDGNIGVDTPLVVWQDPVPGEYDMVFDANQNEVYNDGIDAVDHPNHPGFSVTNPVDVIRAPLLAPLGLAVLIGLLSLIATSTLKGRRQKR
ncbi:MAG: hypothetical protein JW878_11115 [Methanomicrobia archaeon]|nr:hypothetical protein [Methanomicrobia archaeon]